LSQERKIASPTVITGIMLAAAAGVVTAMVVGNRSSSNEEPIIVHHEGDSCCSPSGGKADLPVMFELPDFTLTERSGKTVTRSDLLGRVWVANFIYTTCPGPCPVMTSKMSQLQHDLALAENDDLRFVTITVDPKTDTPETLTAYARKNRAHPNRWLFLTGEVADIYALSAKGFRLAVNATDPPSGDHPILHSTKFVLVDRTGQVRGYYDGVDSAAMEKLRADAQKLLAEKPVATQPGSAS